MNGFTLCVFGCVFLTFLLDGPFTQRKEAASAQAATIKPHWPTSPRVNAEIEMPVEQLAPSLSGEAAAVCASYDPVAHPEQVLDILVYASKETGTPVDVLFAIWMNETGVVYGSGGSDRCPVAEQLMIRCKVGRSCSHAEALDQMAARFHWNTQGMLCSCGTSTMGENTGNFGGCCGPFQFSAGEIAQDALSRNLDPMTFCGGAIVAGAELKRYHDQLGSWEAAIKRYYGLDRDGRYYQHAYQHWQEIKPYIDAQDPDKLRTFLKNTAAPRLAWSRQNRQQTSPLLSSN